MKTVKTNKGTVLPLTNLKGKDYLMTAYRLQWFVEENSRYTINTNFLYLTPEETVAQVTINLYNADGILVKSVQGSKRETKKDFNDHSEKAETGALGRALISLGYGTQYALADLDEGHRIVDSPLTNVKGFGVIEGKTSPLVQQGNQQTPATVAQLLHASPPVETGSNQTLQPSGLDSDRGKPVESLEPKKSSFRKPRAVKTEAPVTAPVLGNGSTKEEDFFGN